MEEEIPEEDKKKIDAILLEANKQTEELQIDRNDKLRDLAKRIEADDVVEFLAEELHKKWIAWAETLLETEPHLSEKRVDRWHEYLDEYEHLPEAAKDIDRQHATYIILLMLHKFPRLSEVFVLRDKSDDKVVIDEKV